jgi:hypothetical protein
MHHNRQASHMFHKNVITILCHVRSLDRCMTRRPATPEANYYKLEMSDVTKLLHSSLLMFYCCHVATLVAVYFGPNEEVEWIYIGFACCFSCN